MSRRKYMKDTGRARQRFSIRKLTIGATSVLLGTVFYLGTNGTITQAADTNNNREEKEIQTVASSPNLKIKTNSDEYNQKITNDAELTVDNEQSENKVENSDRNDVSDKSKIANKNIELGGRILVLKT